MQFNATVKTYSNLIKDMLMKESVKLNAELENRFFSLDYDDLWNFFEVINVGFALIHTHT